MGTPKTELVIIADSQFLVVETVKNLVQADQRFSLAGVVANRDDLFVLLNKNRTGLLITDFETVAYNLPEDLSVFREKYSMLKILVLTNFVSRSDFWTLSKAGIKNIVYKNIDLEELLWPSRQP